MALDETPSSATSVPTTPQASTKPFCQEWVERVSASNPLLPGLIKSYRTLQSQLRAEEAEADRLASLAMRDPLTGFPNRRALEDDIARKIAFIRRSTNELCSTAEVQKSAPANEKRREGDDRNGVKTDDKNRIWGATILFFDLNKFKNINDTYGHDIGDQAIKHALRLIKETLRETDTLGRFGGDEFLAILPNATTTQTDKLIGRLHQKFKETPMTFTKDGREQSLVISTAIGQYQLQVTDLPERVIEEGSKAMKTDKRRTDSGDISQKSVLTISSASPDRRYSGR